MTEFFRSTFPRDAPEGWRRMRVGDALIVVTRPIEMRNDETYRLVSIRRRHGGMFDRERLPGRKILTKDLSQAQVDAFVIAKRQVVHGATCIVPPEFADAALASSYAQLVGSELCDVRFFAWLAQLPAMTCAFYDASQGVVVEKLTLSLAKWLRTKVNLPPLPEQHRIAEILDTVDEAIRKTEEIIAKLKQVKQGLLHDLLTRGIDDNGELRDPDRHPEQFKDSPLGRIPKAWEAVPLGALLDGIDGGWSPACIEQPPPTGQWGVLKVSAVSGGVFRAHESKTLPSSLAPRPELEVKWGDVVLTRANGVAELVGVTAQAGEIPPCLMLSDKLLRLRPGSCLSRDFLATVMSSWIVRRQIARLMSGSSGQKNISQAQIRSFLVPLPSLAEQAECVARLQSVGKRRSGEEASLAKLRLVKSGLMEDLLTGRVRVTAVLEEAAK